MNDRSGLLCAPEEKAQLETDNGVEQLDYIAYLVNGLKMCEVRESHLLELHKLAVQNIYPCGGTYRNAWRNVHIQGSTHQVPDVAAVPALVSELIEQVNSKQGPAMWRAAFALWRLNWIHPFAGGNGRTSRALSYLILCMDIGGMLPGIPTVPTLISERRDEYLVALRMADAGAKEHPDGEPELSGMAELLKDVVTQQLAAAIDFLDRG